MAEGGHALISLRGRACAGLTCWCATIARLMDIRATSEATSAPRTVTPALAAVFRQLADCRANLESAEVSGLKVENWG